MSPDQFTEVETHMEALDDHALLRLVAVDQQDYRSEAITIACAELRRRGVAVPNKGGLLDKVPL